MKQKRNICVPLRKLEELKFTELDAFNRSKTLFTITVSPLEEHGPHLPLGVDMFNADYFADELSQRFLKKYPEWNVIKMPALAVGSFAFDAPGTIKVRPKIIRELLIDSLSSLAKYEFKYFMISNAHGGPTHIVALEEAARIVSKRYGAKVFSFTGHIAWEFLRGKYWAAICERLSMSKEDTEALKDDAHAGQWETSMMLKLRPDLVDPEFQKLNPFVVRTIERLQPDYPLKRENGLGYVGHPSKATKELAEVSSEFLLENVFDIVERQIFSEKLPAPSMFYRVPFFRTGFVKVFVLLVLFALLLILIFKL
jgi:creatinine amidohydrolase